MTKAFASAVLCVFTFVAATGVARASATPAQKCASSKIKETGKKANGKLTCWSKEVVRPGSLAACTAAVEGKFADRFARAEGKGGCGTTGDAGPIEAKVDAFVDDVVTALTGSPPGVILGTDDAQRGASAKLRATGKKTASKTKCYAKAATTGTLDALCISAAEARFGQKWGATEGKGGCATSGDQATIEGTVDAFVNVCGDGIVGSGETCDPPGQQGGCAAGQICNLTCTGCQTVCGDGIVGSGETCDPPGSQSTCGAGTICNSTCTGCEQNCGDLWQTGPAMDAACGPCVAAVCSSDSGCCSVTWDSTCVSVALFLSAGGVCP